MVEHETQATAEFVTVLNTIDRDLFTSRQSEKSIFDGAEFLFFFGGFIFPIFWFIGSFVPGYCHGDPMAQRWKTWNRVLAITSGFVLIVTALVLDSLCVSSDTYCLCE